MDSCLRRKNRVILLGHQILIPPPPSPSLLVQVHMQLACPALEVAAATPLVLCHFQASGHSGGWPAPLYCSCHRSCSPLLTLQCRGCASPEPASTMQHKEEDGNGEAHKAVAARKKKRRRRTTSPKSHHCCPSSSCPMSGPRRSSSSKWGGILSPNQHGALATASPAPP